MSSFKKYFSFGKKKNNNTKKQLPPLPKPPVIIPRRKSKKTYSKTMKKKAMEIVNWTVKNPFKALTLFGAVYLGYRHVTKMKTRCLAIVGAMYKLLKGLASNITFGALDGFFKRTSERLLIFCEGQTQLQQFNRIIKRIEAYRLNVAKGVSEKAMRVIVKKVLELYMNTMEIAYGKEHVPKSIALSSDEIKNYFDLSKQDMDNKINAVNQEIRNIELKALDVEDDTKSWAQSEKFNLGKANAAKLIFEFRKLNVHYKKPLDKAQEELKSQREKEKSDARDKNIEKLDAKIKGLNDKYNGAMTEAANKLKMDGDTFNENFTKYLNSL